MEPVRLPRTRVSATIIAMSLLNAIWIVAAGGNLRSRIGRLSADLKEKGVRRLRLTPLISWLRGKDLNLRPLGYEPNELPGCSTPRQGRRTLSNGFSLVKPRRERLCPLQRFPIPATEVCRGRVRVLEERQELAIGFSRPSHRVVRQDPLPHLRGKARGGRSDPCVGVAVRRRNRVGVERRLGHRTCDVAGPEPESRLLVDGGVARDPFRHVRHRHLARRGGPSGIEGQGQVEASPEQVDRARLALERRSETLENAVRRRENAPEPPREM